MKLKDERTRASQSRFYAHLRWALARLSLSIIAIPLKQNTLFLGPIMIFKVKNGGQLDPC